MVIQNRHIPLGGGSKLKKDKYKARPDGGQGLTRTIPIETIDGGKKDVLLRRANIKKNYFRIVVWDFGFVI